MNAEAASGSSSMGAASGSVPMGAASGSVPMGAASGSRIVLPAPVGRAASATQRIPRPPIPSPQKWAPAWFYSALGWLGKTYYDANDVEQGFNSYLAGSDVDPYAELGSTRLFLITRIRDTFRLSIAPTADSFARAVDATGYPATDQGIRDMYLALAGNPVSAQARFCYVPGRIGPDLDPAGDYSASLANGYDPASGLRAVVLGTAVSQVVPLDDFVRIHNEQIYDQRPTIVPLVTALVYDLSKYDELGATTFALPTVYTRDRIGVGVDYVNRLGQTAVFAGGPGYDDATASDLRLQTVATLELPDHLFATYNFDTAKVYTTSQVGTRVRLGITELTCHAASPAAIFANQRILGFYRDDAWANCLGLPIWDYQTDNAQFTATTAEQAAPTTVYDPDQVPLSGGSLANAVTTLRDARYLCSPDALLDLIGSASAGESANGFRLLTTAAALDFNLSSAAASSPIIDQLAVPVTVSVTTTPDAPTAPPVADERLPLARVGDNGVARLDQVIGGGGQASPPTTPAPVTVRAALTASIPREALDGTGITSLQVGTRFPEHALGDAAAFLAGSAGQVINLMERFDVDPPLAPYDLPLARLKVQFRAGIGYVLSLTATALTVRGSDGSMATDKAIAQDKTHTYIGSMTYAEDTKSVRLYPKLRLTLPAPAVGSNGVLQSATYHVRLTYGEKTSAYDLADAGQLPVATGVTVPNPENTDQPSPRPGDQYFGSFVGGEQTMTVWSVPVFLSLRPDDLPGAGGAGSMALDAQVSGVPAFRLQVTDSSVFVFTNIDLDTSQSGQADSANVFLASAVINSSPDDTSAQAFAPSPVHLGLVRPVLMGASLKYVFVPVEDSVVIGSLRYMTSVIELEALSFDPSSRPYPPAAWPSSQYWQFANKHNPYLDVEYAGATQADRVAGAQADASRIGADLRAGGEPMHLYLDTDRKRMTITPIWGFPFDPIAQSVDHTRLQEALQNVAELVLASAESAFSAADYGSLDAERIAVPEQLRQGNPYASMTAVASTAAAPLTQEVIQPVISGRAVTNLSPDVVADATVNSSAHVLSAKLRATQRAAADQAFSKQLDPAAAVVQDRPASSAGQPSARPTVARFQPVYGFTVYNSSTGEAYLVEVVNADQDVFDQLPGPTEHLTYDPYYVRVVFLRTLTCYHMSIIVPSMAHDQYGHFARTGTEYANLLSKVDELRLGYLYSLFDAQNAFDDFTFAQSSSFSRAEQAYSQRVIFTNLPYSLARGDDRPINESGIQAPYFACRRKNWSADCHLMLATHSRGSAAYLAFGAGDLVPLRLDAAFDVDRRPPAHLYKLTYTFSDRQYDAAKTISVANMPYVVAVTTNDAGSKQYVNFSINATAGTADLQMTHPQQLTFPKEVYVAGQASATLISMDELNAALGASLTDTGDFLTLDELFQPTGQEFELIPYNNLVYLVRAVTNCAPLGAVGGLGTTAGLLIDTYVPATTGNLTLAQGARHKRSQLQFFGATYTPTTMVDTLDNLDFTSITGETFYAPTIFIPIPELDATKGFVAQISDFVGQQFWTFIYPEIIAGAGDQVNGVTWDRDVNLDADGKPVLSLQKLHFVYDPLVVLFTPNDLTHKYPLQPKQQVLALTNAQIREGICWRSANVQPHREPPRNICAQQILPEGEGMDRPNIIYSAQNRPVATSTDPNYLGMSVYGFRSVSGAIYSIEESALANDQTGSSFISSVSSTTNLVLGVLFEYDNDDLGTVQTLPSSDTTKGLVLLNGYLAPPGYVFSSPDHFDVNDVLPSQVPLLEQIADTMGFDVAYFNTDVSLPRQFWSLAYDTATAAGLPNFIPNVPPSAVDPGFSNRTRSLILSLQNPVHPEQLGLMDTYSSVVSANLHLANGVTGSVFLSKKADRDVASIGSNPVGSNSYPLFGLPTKYDFFIFSRDHYWTLKGAAFELVDQGYAMCLVDDGSGTGSKVAKYLVDADGNYYELFSYAIYSPDGGVLETSSFTLRVTLGSPGNLSASPVIPETPNSVNPQDLVAQLNQVSKLVYAAFGPSTPGQAPAYLPIQAVGGAVPAAPIMGAPGFNGYQLNVAAGNRQPVQISQIYSGTTAYPIDGSTTITPINPKTGKPVPYYGSISHGLDRMLPATLQSSDGNSVIPRPTVPAGPATGLFGGNGLGALIATPFSCAFQGSGAVPPAITGNANPGTTMKADDAVFYTYNAVTNMVMDSAGKSTQPAGGQYFIDPTDPMIPVYAVVTLPKFTLNGITYNVVLSTTLADGVTSRYSLVVGGRSYQFGPDNAQVTVDRTVFTFNALKGGAYTVTMGSLDQPAVNEAPSPISLTPFSIAMGGTVAVIDVFNDPGALAGVVLGVVGRQYAYDPVHGSVTITEGADTTTVAVRTGLVFPSGSGYGYVIGYQDGSYTVNGTATFRYSALTTGTPATHALLTAPQMFTIGGNFFTLDRGTTGGYTTVTGNQQTYPVNPYQFSVNGEVYVIDTSVQPNRVIGGGNVYPMSAGNAQFVLNGVQYTIALRQGSLNGATVSGQFDISQANVVVIEDYVYEIDTLNGQLIGNGASYPLTSAGLTYTISTTDKSFTVTTEPYATTVTIAGIVHQINNTTVVGDEVVYPIVVYRTFVGDGTTYDIGLDGVVSVPATLPLSGTAPYVRSTFTDGQTYTVNDLAAFDGTSYFRISGALPGFAAGGRGYTLRTDGVSIAAGGAKTYLVDPTGPLSPNQFTFGTQTIHLGRPTDLAAFDGQNYYAIVNGQFTDTTTATTFTLSGNTAVHEGNSYEIFSNLGANPYFAVPDGPTYYISIPVADTGSASGDVFNVFPISGGQFTMPIRYTITVAGAVVTVDAITFAGGPTTMASLTAAGGSLTGGYFVDPVTRISYSCIVDGTTVSFVDSNNVRYPFPSPATADLLVAAAVVATGVPVAVDDQATPVVHPVLNNQFITEAATYTVNLPIAYVNPAGPYFPMVNGRFIVPQADPVSDLAYTVSGGNVVKGWLISADDGFSVDGDVLYTINAVNVVRASNRATLAGAVPNQTLTDGPLTYQLDGTGHLASYQPPGVTFDTGTQRFTATVNGRPISYTVGATSATDDRVPQNTFPVSQAGAVRTFTDPVGGLGFSVDTSGDNPVTARFAYTNDFFIDVLIGLTYYVDVADDRVEALSYLPEVTQYAFTAGDGRTYLIHYDDVLVRFPVISGANVEAGVATVGADTVAVEIDEVTPVAGGSSIPVNRNSFEINGNLYTIAGTPVGSDYSGCSVLGAGGAARAFTSPSTFTLLDPMVVYTVHLDADDLPVSIEASFAIRPSRDLLSINDDVFVISYSTVSTGSLLGQGQASIPISNSGFTLTNRFDTTRARFIFADLDIFDAAAVVGQFSVYLAPTFFLDGRTYTFDPVRQLVIDADKRQIALVPNPTMFSINGSNYLIDTNRTPHAVIGNDNVSPLATDITVEDGRPVPHSTFTLNGQVYEYAEGPAHTLLAITGATSYPIARPAMTFKLDSSLVFTLSTVPPAAGNYVGSVVPIGTVTAAGTVLNVYPGTPESAGADFFTYKNVLYTLVRSGTDYLAVQKSYTVYAADPAATQQQLALFDLDGTSYLVTEGSTAGDAAPTGINPGTMWAATSVSNVETQFGLVYGFTAQPTAVTRSASGVMQFQVTDSSGIATLYDIQYAAGSNANVVKVDVPALLPTFTQAGPFSFTPSYPLTFETGGYNAFTTFVDETSTPNLSFAAAYKTPITSADPLIDSLMTTQGDLSLEFWHSIPASTPSAYHPVRYAASTSAPLVYYVDVDFEDDSNIYLGINNTVLHAAATPPVFSSGWRHVALSYQQPYTMLCKGAGFEVKKGSSFNFNRDFSIAMTFAVSDASAEQGLLYKGTASDITTPQLSMSYRVGISGGQVSLQFTDANNELSPLFLGPSISDNQFFQLIIVKHTTTPAGRDDSSDPYAAPFDTTDLGTLASSGMSGHSSGFPSGGGDITISSMAPAGAGANTRTSQFLAGLSAPPVKRYSVVISVRTVLDDGTFGAWQSVSTSHTVTNGDPGLAVNPTGGAHLLIGAAFSDDGTPVPLGSTAGAVGNIREVSLFNGAIDSQGRIRRTDGTLVDLALASSDDLVRAGLVGIWAAVYDANGLITNPYDSDAFATSTNLANAYLAPLTGHEREGAVLYVNGYQMSLALVTGSQVPSSMTGYSAGSSELSFNAGLYRLAEISLWRMIRQQYQVVDDMFGRLVPSNEPFLILYLSGSFEVQAINAPILPMNSYIDHVDVTNAVAALDLALSTASLDLAGCPAVGRCGPLITPNLYTPPGVALTVCDTVPYLTTYSVTLNTLTASLAGELNEAYVYVKAGVLTLYAGKKIGDLVLSWVSQEQGDVQLIGYIEGAPPAPMANLTNKASYAGATSITLSAPTSVTLKLQRGYDSSDENKLDYSDAMGFQWGLGFHIAPFGFGMDSDKTLVSLSGTFGVGGSYTWTSGDGSQITSSNKLDESNKYTVKLQGAPAPVTGDLFMAGLNSVTTPSSTAGTAVTRSAILPNPSLGGFTSSNPAAPLPKVPSDEKFGARMFVPTPYGQAFVTSQTLDVYQQTLVQSNTVFGFVRIPNSQIPRDLNIVSFRMNSKYLRPGVLDGVVGYAYNPATLPTGAQTYGTSTGELQAVYDKNFSAGEVGHDASYMRIVEAYRLKRQIDQQAFNALALYQAQYNAQAWPTDSRLTPGLDFYNEYLWTARGGTQEVKHVYTTTYDEVYTTTSGNTAVANVNFNIKLGAATLTVLDVKFAYTYTSKFSIKSSYNTTGTSSFDISASFDGIESDTQMRYASNNDAHFVMRYNSMFNPNNQSGLNVVIGSDGLVYTIVPNVSSGAGLPMSNNADDSQTYQQPQPSYTSGNASGNTGALEPYDRPGKVKQFRSYAFFLQPTEENADNFWNQVVDPVWLANSPEADADAMRSAQQHRSIPWRLLYRVTYVERYLPPVSTDAVVVPQVMPVMAIPVLDPASDFLFTAIDAAGPRPLHNPHNDIEANVVLTVPTSSGASVGSTVAVGPNTGLPVLGNNVIPFDLAKDAASIVSWGDAPNTKLLSQLTMSVLGVNVVPMLGRVAAGSTRLYDVLDPAHGIPLYTVYTDPNGLTVNVSARADVTVYQDVNGNPIQYYDGKAYHSLQQDYVATADGTIMYYIQPPASYDQSTFDLTGDDDLFGHPGDEWRYYLVSGMSANMTSEPTVLGRGPFESSEGYSGLRVAPAQHTNAGAKQVQGYVLAQGVLQWPHLNTNAEAFADVLVYKAMSLLDTFPIGDPEVLVGFLRAQFGSAPFVDNEEICTVFARNIVSYFNASQQSLVPK